MKLPSPSVEAPVEVPIAWNVPSPLAVHVIPFTVVLPVMPETSSKLRPSTLSISTGLLGLGVPSCTDLPWIVRDSGGRFAASSEVTTVPEPVSVLRTSVLVA